MKTIEIRAREFFDILKTNDTSMWTIFSQMVDGEEKNIIFIDEDEKEVFSYLLPSTKEQLEIDQKRFAEIYQDKLNNLN